jgi:inosine/guanosine/xanthosine phosphorylase family protein
MPGDATARRAARAAAVLRGRLGAAPRVAVVLGSGLGGFAGSLAGVRRLGYAAIPGFPVPGVPGHAGEVRCGRLGEARVAALCGRSHLYEGHDAAAVAFPIEALAAWGVRVLVLTNAAGGLAPALRPGAVMLVRDHVNLLGGNPLRGRRDPAGRPCFVDLSDAYDARLARLARAAARRLRVPLRSGVLVAVPGPSFETPAEGRWLRRLGGDAVGMSTVPEVIMARACGLRVVVLTLIANRAAGRAAPVRHADVLAAGPRARGFRRLLAALVQGADREATGGAGRA